MVSQISFTLIGNYRTVSYDTPFSNVTSINGWIVDTENEIPNYAYLGYEFRWSINGDNWSLWIELTDDNLKQISLSTLNPFYLEFRITALSNPNVSPHLNIGSPINPAILLNDIEPDLSYLVIDQRNLATKPKILCSNEQYDKPVIFNPDCTTIFDPYAVNRGINMYKDLSMAANLLFGHQVNYYSVQPNGRGKDIILREYNLFDVVDEKCIKVLVLNNDFGDGKPIYDTFGINFEKPIEAHIDKGYFESIFGKGSQPRKRDIIFFPLTNRIYSIESTYLHRDFDYAPLYFKCQLNKWENRRNTSWDNAEAYEALTDYTVSAETLFSSATNDQIEKVTKPQEYYVSSQRRYEDPVRPYVSLNLPIIQFDLNNNWTVVFNTYYDLETLSYDGELEGVRYRVSPELDVSSEISFTCWLKIRNFIDPTKLVPKAPRKLSISSYVQAPGTITYSTYPVKHLLPVTSSPASEFPDSSGYIGILGGNKDGGYKILTIPDSYTFSVVDNGTPIIGDITTWKAQQAQGRTLIDGTKNGQGLRIEMIWTGSNLSDGSNSDYLQIGSYRILINGFEILSPFGSTINTISSNFIPTLDDWYGFVFNLSNIYNQYSINTWGLTYDPKNPSTQTSNLTLLHSQENFLSEKYTFNLPVELETDLNNPTWNTDNNSYKLLSSPIYITNVRIFKYMIAQEKQSAILNQNIVGDSELANVIDNAKLILKLPKISNNK